MEGQKYLVLYLTEDNTVKTFGTFSADDDELACKKAQSILSKFPEKMKIAMGALGSYSDEFLCNIEIALSSFPVYKFGGEPQKAFISKD